MENDSLGDRMKAYEHIPASRLLPRVPVMARLDGKAFHTFTRGMERPYDVRLNRAMWRAATYLCEEVQGCKLAYVQSDEITLLLTDWGNIHTQPWFGYEVQKMCSVAAGMCSVAFLDAIQAETGSVRGLPCFDARFWNLPVDEVVNCFIWRQQDATRNSIQMLGQAHFSPKRLHGMSCEAIQDALFTEKGINWNDCRIPQKRGACIVRRQESLPVRDVLGQEKYDTLLAAGRIQPDMIIDRGRWVVDQEIPIFTQDRDYVARRLHDPAPPAEPREE